MRELVPRQVDKKPRVPEEKGSGALEVEIGVLLGILKEERTKFLCTLLSQLHNSV